jgi:hypothetical protein
VVIDGLFYRAGSAEVGEVGGDAIAGGVVIADISRVAIPGEGEALAGRLIDTGSCVIMSDEEGVEEDLPAAEVSTNWEKR